MPRNISTIIVALLVIVIIASIMCFYQVRFTETAVVTRFDRIIEGPPVGPGLHFRLPWPIDSVHYYDTRIRTFETEFRQAATRDQKTVILTAYATWRIADATKFLKAVGQEDTATQIIRDLLENQVQLVLRDHDLEELVNVDQKKMKLEEIERTTLLGSGDQAANEAGSRAKTGIRGPARDKYGIEIVSVGVKRLGLPESVTQEVFTRMKENRQEQIKRYQAEGKAEAIRIRVTAEEISQKILARAEAYAKTLEGEGEAEAARYYSVFENNLALSTFLKKLDTVRDILASGQITLVLDAKKIIPLDIFTEDGGASPETDEQRSGKTRVDDEPTDPDEVVMDIADDEVEE